MLFCPKCNGQVEDNASFCPHCGVPFITDNENVSAETTVLPNNNVYPATPQAQSPNPPQAQQFSYTNGQPTNQQVVYRVPGPVAQLKTNRSFIKTVLLSLITFGIYGLICYGHITDDVNLVCSRYDGKKSMNYYLLTFIVGPLTLGVGSIVWMHKICERIGTELTRRQMDYHFGAKDFWLWGVLGSLIIIGPLVFTHKFFKAVNKMNANFNQFG